VFRVEILHAYRIHHYLHPAKKSRFFEILKCNFLLFFQKTGLRVARSTHRRTLKLTFEGVDGIKCATMKMARTSESQR
jgi:hypothetical protein